MERRRLQQSSLSPSSQQRLGVLLTDVSPQLNVPSYRRPSLFKVAQPSTDFSHELEDWVCPMCRLRNDVKDLQCGACDYGFWECTSSPCGALNDGESQICADCRVCQLCGLTVESTAERCLQCHPFALTAVAGEQLRSNGPNESPMSRRRRRDNTRERARPQTRRRHPLEAWDELGVTRSTIASAGWTRKRTSTPSASSARSNAQQAVPLWLPPGVTTVYDTWHTLDKAALAVRRHVKSLPSFFL